MCVVNMSREKRFIEIITSTRRTNERNFLFIEEIRFHHNIYIVYTNNGWCVDTSFANKLIENWCIYFNSAGATAYNTQKCLYHQWIYHNFWSIFNSLYYVWTNNTLFSLISSIREIPNDWMHWVKWIVWCLTFWACWQFNWFVLFQFDTYYWIHVISLLFLT